MLESGAWRLAAIGSLGINERKPKKERRGTVELWDRVAGKKRRKFRGKIGGERFGTALFVSRNLPGDFLEDIVASKTHAPIPYIPE